MTKLDNFLSTGLVDWEPAQPVRHISVEVHYWSKFEFEALKVVLVISPSSKLRIVAHHFFVGLLILR